MEGIRNRHPQRQREAHTEGPATTSKTVVQRTVSQIQRNAIPARVKHEIFWSILTGHYFAVAVYFAVGVTFYTVFTGWAATDAAYFVVMVLSTVGYGDLAPEDPASRLFTGVYAVIGVILVANSLSTILSKVLEKQSLLILRLLSSSETRKNLRVHELGSSQSSSALLASILHYVMILALGGFVLARWQDLGLADTFYFVSISATTVGLGDIAPQSSLARSFAVLWVLLATVGLARVIGATTDFKLNQERDRVRQNLLRAPLTEDSIAEMDHDSDFKVSKHEFLAWFLVNEGKVTQAEVDEIMGRFEELDADGSGYLDSNDMKKDN
mmetsp:Transcript_10383/g.20933  ORF Transcript_10383/g.20933 Transcript_10383/m.20933 type:complete len:326 (-) Transcript_10383:1818-2795(-)